MGCSIIVSGFVGLGNILAGRQDLLPNMRLHLTLRGCPCKNETFEATCSEFELDDPYQLDLADNSNWKDEDYSAFVKIWSTSYSNTRLQLFTSLQ
jgi:hypothetical protein